MLISKDVYYGIRGLIFLAKNGNSSLKEISKKEKIPAFFLGKIFQKLKKRKILGSKKGLGGGFYLILSPKKITLKKIVKNLKHEYISVPCLNFSKKFYCPKILGCRTRKGWKKFYSNLNRILDEISLEDFLK